MCVIGERPTDRAVAPPLARDCRDPAGLARSIALRDRNAEALFEAPPFLDRERSGARGEEAQRRQIVAIRRAVAVEQDVDRGGVAGGHGDAMLAHMREEAAGGELLRHHQRRAAIDRHQRAEELRRCPVERPEIIQTIVCGDAEAIGRRIDVQEVLAIAEHDTFRLRAGAGGEQDHGIVVRPGVRMRVRRRATCRLAEECVGRRRVPVAKLQPRGRHRAEEIVEPQALLKERVLTEHKLRRQPREDVVELIAVHLDMDGADGRAVGHHAEIADQVLDRIVGEQRDAVVAADAALAEQGGDPACGVAQRAVADGASIVRRHDPRLVRIARRGARNPVLQQKWAGVYCHRNRRKILSIISISHFACHPGRALRRVRAAG